jgi:O-acetyl-ADP-ribose deacetylase (regulator of RNase III)
MIEYRQGNLLEADAEALVNTVNCVGIMGKGIALQFKMAFPDNYREYQQACRRGEVQLGRIFTVDRGGLGQRPRLIFNFPTKQHWKSNSKLEDIANGLEDLVCELRRYGVTSVAVPPLGCGLGGLDWSEVKPLIEHAFAEVLDVQVLVFTPKGAPAADTMPVATVKPQLTRARALILSLMEFYGFAGYELTFLEIQKLAYFLQEAGEPLRLDYAKAKFGPYAHNLNHVLERLEGHYIRGFGGARSDATVVLLPTAMTEAGEVITGSKTARERLERVRRLIQGFETPYGMELLATVHWGAKADREAASDFDRAFAAVENWSARKKWLFKPEHVRKAWERLRDERWIG